MRKKLILIILMILITAGYAGYLFMYPGEAPEEIEPVTLWYVDGNDPSGYLVKLSEELDKLSAGSGLRLILKSFKSESELAGATGIARPDLILCSYEKADELYGRGGITEVKGTGSYPLPEFSCFAEGCSACIGKAFFPLGIETDVLVYKPDIDIGEMSLEQFSEYGRSYASDTGNPFFTADSYTSLMNSLLCANGGNCTADEDFGSRPKRFAACYNLLAEAVSSGSLLVSDSHGLPMVEAGAIPCAIVPCGEMRFVNGEVRTCLLPTPEGKEKVVAGGCVGLAVTASETADFGNIVKVLSLLYENGFADSFAESSYLLPTVLKDEESDCGKLLWGYSVMPLSSRSDGSFEKYFREAMEHF